MGHLLGYEKVGHVYLMQVIVVNPREADLVVKGSQSRTRFPSGRESRYAKTRVLHIAPMTAGRTGR